MLALLLLPFYIAATKQSFVFFRRKQDLFFLSAFWVLSLLVTIFSGGTVTDILLGVFMVFAFIAVIFVTYTMTQRAFRLILSFVWPHEPLLPPCRARSARASAWRGFTVRGITPSLQTPITMRFTFRSSCSSASTTS